MPRTMSAVKMIMKRMTMMMMVTGAIPQLVDRYAHC